MLVGAANVKIVCGEIRDEATEEQNQKRYRREMGLKHSPPTPSALLCALSSTNKRICGGTSLFVCLNTGENKSTPVYVQSK